MSNPRVTGAIRYAQDVEFEGMLHASILRSPYPSARVAKVDTSAVPDSVVVLTPDDVRELGKYGCQIKDQTVLAVDRVRFVGDPVVAVAAPTKREADEALDLIDVEYEQLPGVYDAVEAVAKEAPLVHEHHAVSENDAAYFEMRPQQGTNICHRFRIRHGGMDIEESPTINRGATQTDVIVEETYRTASAQHAAMEPHASVARWEGGRLELWTGTQTPFNLRTDLAGVFHIPESQIRIICPPMGGAFGAKTFVRVEAIVACLARKAGRPVKMVLSRYEEWLTLNRHPATLRVKLGARADGTLVSKRVECWVDTGAYADYAGRVVNRPGAELQNEGSMIMGLGTTLFEGIHFEEGQPTNANLSDYNIPAAGDLPEFFSHDLIEREGADIHRLGETALPPVPPAVGNALYSLGIHVTNLPISAEAVLNAIDHRQQLRAMEKGEALQAEGGRP